MEEKFNYNYSAKQQKEVENIRNKYIYKSEDKMQKLINLDKSVTKTGRTVSIIVGIISTLLLGIGMCMCMEIEGYFVLGIIVGVVGIAGVSFAYPLYKAICKRKRKKIAPEILALSDEIMNEK